MTRTAVIVQARMGSTRLPGKVMETLAGETVLRHVLRRCAAVDGVDVVCCAVPEGCDSDPVAAEAERCEVEVFRGSEDDVLDRYYRAARALGADIVMRVTSDCPVIDPRICHRVLRLRGNENADYACNNMPRSWPLGLDCEVFTFAWLERAAREAVTMFEREHVTPFIRRHAEVRMANLDGPGGVAATYCWTLDTEADLCFLRALFQRLPRGPEGWDYRVPLAIVEADPALAAINARQDRCEGRKNSAAEIGQ